MSMFMDLFRSWDKPKMQSTSINQHIVQKPNPKIIYNAEFPKIFLPNWL